MSSAGLTARLKQMQEDTRKKKEEAVQQRLKDNLQQLVNSEQIKLACQYAPDSAMAVDWLANNLVTNSLNPVSDYEDTLRAKGFKPADIRWTTRNLYITYCSDREHVKEVDMLTYEQMVKEVAVYVAAHQELYNTLEIQR